MGVDSPINDATGINFARIRPRGQQRSVDGGANASLVMIGDRNLHPGAA
jgi:hypothetical protein